MRSFFPALSAIVSLLMGALLVVVLVTIQPVRLEAESSPPPPPPWDGSVADAEENDAPEARVDAAIDAPGWIPCDGALHVPAPDATATAPEVDEDPSFGCDVAAGGRPAGASAQLGSIGLALAAAALARRRKA